MTAAGTTGSIRESWVRPPPIPCGRRHTRSFSGSQEVIQPFLTSPCQPRGVVYCPRTTMRDVTELRVLGSFDGKCRKTHRCTWVDGTNGACSACSPSRTVERSRPTGCSTSCGTPRRRPAPAACCTAMSPVCAASSGRMVAEIVRQGDGYALIAPEFEIDAHRFTALVDEAEQVDDPARPSRPLPPRARPVARRDPGRRRERPAARARRQPAQRVAVAVHGTPGRGAGEPRRLRHGGERVRRRERESNPAGKR